MFSLPIKGVNNSIAIIVLHSNQASRQTDSDLLVEKVLGIISNQWCIASIRVIYSYHYGKKNKYTSTYFAFKKDKETSRRQICSQGGEKITKKDPLFWSGFVRRSLGEAWLLDATNFPKESQSVIAWMNAMFTYISLHHQIKADLRHFVAKEPQPNCFNDFL